MPRHDDDNDNDLEAELEALTSGQSKSPEKNPKPKPVIKQSELDRMVAKCMKDLDEEDILDDDDPNLLNELQEITGEKIEEIKEEQTETEPVPEVETFVPTSTTNLINLLNERLEMYKIAEQNAKTANETSRAHRFNRGLKTIQDLMKQVKSGKSIDNDDIPPELNIKVELKPAVDIEKESPSPAITQSSIITPTTDVRPVPEPKPLDPKMQLLKTRQHDYKMAALQADKDNNIEDAKQFVKIVKQFDAVMKMAEDGQPIDLSDMPPPPDQLKDFLAKLNSEENFANPSETNESEVN